MDNDRESVTSNERLEKEEISGCAKRLKVNRSLLPLKCFFFTFMGGIGAVIPYIAVFLKQLGMGPQQIGLIFGIRPVVGFISGPVWGIMGDKYRIRKQLLLFSIFAWIGILIGLFHIPPAGRSGKCPTQPHRRPLVEEPHTNTTVGNLTQQEVDILREDIGWIYTQSGLNRIFITGFVVIIIGEFFQAPTIALSDAGTIQTLGPGELSRYGAQRAWGAVGWAISSFFGGSLVSMYRHPEIVCGVEIYFSYYQILAYLFAGFMGLCLIAATQIKFKGESVDEATELTSIDKSSTNITTECNDEVMKGNDVTEGVGHSTKDVLLVFNNLHYGSWLATCFYVGICNGLIWGFLYWHLENLGADQLLMGLDSFIQCVAEFLAFLFVHRFIDVMGHMTLLYMGLLGYGIRFMAYALIKNPWLALPCDILQGLTFSCVWVSMTSYTAISVPEDALATTQGILHGVYTGLGNGVGHLLGGVLIGKYGAVVTFYSAGISSIIVLIIFVVAQKCSNKPQTKFNYQSFDNEKATSKDE